MAIGPTRTDRLPILALLALAIVAGPLLLGGRPAHAAATFVVTLTGDAVDLAPGDGACDASFGTGDQCTLRAAIQEANALLGADTIRFNLPGDGVRVISPPAQLPKITEAVFLDGYSQPGSRRNTAATGTDAVLRIVLDGSVAGDRAKDGLEITAANVVVRGLVVAGYRRFGISVAGSSATGVRIEGCFVGTAAAGGVARGNGDGIGVFAPGTRIGGADPAARNLISGNRGNGLYLGHGTRDARVLGNLIGSDRSGAKALANGRYGVRSFAVGATVGGDGPGEANVVAFNAAGVVVEEPGVANMVLRNAIFANAGLGIDLGDDGETPNDPGDFDRGGNGLQNKPAIEAASATSVRGTLHSTPNATFTIRVYSSPSGDEGKVMRGGPVRVTTTASGNADFSVPTTALIPRGHRVTATATGADGTSEFSAAKSVPA